MIRYLAPTSWHHQFRTAGRSQRRESNPVAKGPSSVPAHRRGYQERTTGIEPATFTLEE